FEIAFHMNTWEVNRAFRIVVDTQRTQKFDLRRFEVAEHRGVMNPPAGVGVNETDTRLKNERRRHLIVLPQHSGSLGQKLNAEIAMLTVMGCKQRDRPRRFRFANRASVLRSAN